jgi:PQQ-dependent dehydrogenase (methanol/ethanol family)
VNLLRDLSAFACVVALSCAALADTSASVDAKRLTHANAEPGQWMLEGRTYDQQRFSPLKQINTDTVSRLGLAWYADFDSNRGQEATPLVIDGVIYLSTAWSKVKAYDARTGRLLWAYDPKVPGEFAGRGCCDVVNRGLAAWNGKIYVASYDGWLTALDARTGAQVWHVLTLDHNKPVTSTGAPLAFNGKIVIGNAGGEFGVRGYITAYDAETGKQIWRFYTVPGNPAEGFEQPELKQAAATWSGDWWTAGGGGTVWDGILYDPKLNLLYFGTGNGSPWNRKYRGSGGGDNLFIASIIAVNADTGAHVWHYQEVPGEEFDYDATSPLMIADLKIAGRSRHVLLQAAKDGFFYVWDAKSGKVISARPFVTVTWATGVDPRSGRPILNPQAFYDMTGKPALLQPGGQGAHSWHPFSFNPQTGLVYFSGIETGGVMTSAKTYTYQPMGANTGIGFASPDALTPEQRAKLPRGGESTLVAWDPVQNKQVWRTGVLGNIGAGTLSTAGGLVFQGTTKGKLVAYRATDGQELWSMEAETGVVAAPSTFELDGQQYLAEEVGYGLARYGTSNQSRLLVLRLGGSVKLPPAPPPPPAPVLNPPPSTASQAVIETGHQQFSSHCAMCHDTQYANRALFPDLRYSPALNSAQAFDAIVIQGALQGSGMASFKDRITEPQAQSIRAYVIDWANKLKNAPPAAGPGAR